LIIALAITTHSNKKYFVSKRRGENKDSLLEKDLP
jgi:hypothetical protein